MNIQFYEMQKLRIKTNFDQENQQTGYFMVKDSVKRKTVYTANFFRIIPTEDWHVEGRGRGVADPFAESRGWRTGHMRWRVRVRVLYGFDGTNRALGNED